MHHGSAVVKMNDLIFDVSLLVLFFPFAVFRENLCFRNELTIKKMCLRNYISQQCGLNISFHLYFWIMNTDTT